VAGSIDLVQAKAESIELGQAKAKSIELVQAKAGSNYETVVRGVKKA
jgi:hypothetical protein